MTITTTQWFDDLSNLFTGKSPKEYPAFKESMERVFEYVRNKSGDRCISSSLFNIQKREKMISDLFRTSKSHPTTTELCNTKFMRHLVKRNRDNETNLNFIYEKIVPAQIKKISETLMHDPVALLWMREFHATITNPKTIEKQKNIPEPFSRILVEGKAEIGAKLEFAIKNGWINKEKIKKIIEEIQTQKIEELDLPSFEEKNIIPFFVQSYSALIAAGEKYSEQYKQIILIGLNSKKLPN